MNRRPWRLLFQLQSGGGIRCAIIEAGKRQRRASLWKSRSVACLLVCSLSASFSPHSHPEAQETRPCSVASLASAGSHA